MIFVSWNSADYPVYLVITYFQQINLLPSRNSANFIKYEELDYPLKTFVIIIFKCYAHMSPHFMCC